ncbi:hypothetical protein PMAYCL1PPCAC_15411 [Pristionchus mayeri]|uniref:BZIP domain-containing protein n=1 Tax=Pristionchus mayeri TaxID=1317129 RepID=A0AAN5CIU2_9BILA|nr:hypothetical protein PMAYCL1PPCAC_15411 [Pristionchus mayeri]
MLSNAFRSVCRLRNAAALDANFASLASLGKQGDYCHGSIVERLLLRPFVSPSDCYSPHSYSIRLDSPLSSLGSPCEITGWSLEDEKSFDCKHGIYELDSLICDDLTVEFDFEEAAQSCSRVVDENEPEIIERVSNASFHSFIDDLIATVREEIEREQALEEAVKAERAAKVAGDVAALAAAAATPLANKELDAGLDGSANNRKRIACEYSDIEEVPVLRRRKRMFTLEEMALRKRNQNRRAAQRYREKLVKVKEEQLEECGELEAKNCLLRAHIGDLENEIERFKQMLLTKAEKEEKEM